MLLSVHPCGQVVDFLRFGYHAQMRTVHGQPPVPVVWFRVPKGRPIFSGPSVFRSRNWESDHFNDGIGEQEGLPCCCRRQLDWYRGMAPAPYKGLMYCGTAKAKRRGAFPGEPTFMTDDVGRPPCPSCNLPLLRLLLPTGYRMDEAERRRRTLLMLPTGYRLAADESGRVDHEDLRVGGRLDDVQPRVIDDEDLRTGYRLDEQEPRVIDDEDLATGYRLDDDEPRVIDDEDLPTGYRLVADEPTVMECSRLVPLTICMHIYGIDGEGGAATGRLTYAPNAIAEGINGWTGTLFLDDFPDTGACIGYIWCVDGVWHWKVEGARSSEGTFVPTATDPMTATILLFELPYSAPNQPAVINLIAGALDHPCGPLPPEPPPPPCPCPGDTRTLVMSGNSCPDFNGTYNLVQLPGECVWAGENENGAKAALYEATPPNVEAFVGNGADGDASYFSDAYVCGGPNTLDFFSQFGACVYPPTITVSAP